MKVKKAIKRLDKVDELLSDVIDRYTASEPDTRELLESARKSVLRAQAALNNQVSSKTQTNSTVKAGRKANRGDATVQSNGVKRKRAVAESAQAVGKTA